MKKTHRQRPSGEHPTSPHKLTDGTHIESNDKPVHTASFQTWLSSTHHTHVPQSSSLQFGTGMEEMLLLSQQLWNIGTGQGSDEFMSLMKRVAKVCLQKLVSQNVTHK